jgi:hypothetical protein
MRTITAFIKRHAVPTYHALAFAISWGGIIIVVGPGGVTGTTKPPDVLLPFVYLAMLAGPSVASLLLTGLVDGTAGFRELVSRLLKWRVGARWYAAALLTAPLLMTDTLRAVANTEELNCERIAVLERRTRRIEGSVHALAKEQRNGASDPRSRRCRLVCSGGEYANQTRHCR